MFSSVFSRVFNEEIQSVYPQTRVLSFPGLIRMIWVNQQRVTDVTRVVKAPGAKLYQMACGVVNEQKIFCSHQYSSDISMDKFRRYIHRHVFRPSQDESLLSGLTSREQLMDVTRALKTRGAELCQNSCLVSTKKKYSDLIIVLQSAQ